MPSASRALTRQSHNRTLNFDHLNVDSECLNRSTSKSRASQIFGSVHFLKVDESRCWSIDPLSKVDESRCLVDRSTFVVPKKNKKSESFNFSESGSDPLPSCPKWKHQKVSISQNCYFESGSDPLQSCPKKISFLRIATTKVDRSTKHLESGSELGFCD